MPLSISNSDEKDDAGISSLDVSVRASEGRPHRASMNTRAGILALVSGLVVFFAGLELSSPFILAHLSRTEQRVTEELRGANALRRTTGDGHPTLLLVGNSLLLEGVQLDELKTGLSNQYAVSRLGIEQTHYLDWYFGLRRLLDEGSRPSVIVLSLATDQLASPFTLEESFAHRLMSARDLPLVIRERNLDRTSATSYFFAHWSNWLGDKGFIRQCVMILLVPHFRELGARIADHGPHVNDPVLLLNAAKRRLPELRDLADKYQVRIVLLIPPSLREDHALEVQQLGAQMGIPVWVLTKPGEFTRDYFRDGFHLNHQGAAIFTARLSQQISGLAVYQSASQNRDAPSSNVTKQPESAR
jgi:hypothetical protein